jgi:hypothetical protein
MPPTMTTTTHTTIPYGAAMPPIGVHPGGQVVRPDEGGSAGTVQIVIAFGADGLVTADGMAVESIDEALRLVKQRYEQTIGVDAAAEVQEGFGLRSQRASNESPATSTEGFQAGLDSVRREMP